jgi:hypothetical protein
MICAPLSTKTGQAQFRRWQTFNLWNLRNLRFLTQRDPK